MRVINHNKKRTATKKAGNKHNPPSSSAGGLPSMDRKKNYRTNLPSPTNHVKEEDMRDLLNQLPPPIILMEDLNAHNALWRSKKTQEERC